MASDLWNAALGLTLGVLSLISLLWWIPTDIETGLVEQDRYSVQIGDAMLPTVTALAILALSVCLLGQSLIRMRFGSDDTEQVGLDRGNAISLAIMAGIVGLSVWVMVWTGPAVVDLLNALGLLDKTYRQLSATVPYKYIGFSLGGVAMVFGLIAWVQGRASWRAGWIAIGMTVFLIVVYDLPFDRLLLPPNGSL